MADEKQSRLVHAQEEAETADQELRLGHGRTLRVSGEGSDEVVEIRAASGQLELRMRLTEAGPVLQLEGVRVQMKGAESVEVECKTFAVQASEGMKLATDGELEVTSQKDTRITSPAEVFVKGKMIWLN